MNINSSKIKLSIWSFIVYCRKLKKKNHNEIHKNQKLNFHLLNIAKFEQPTPSKKRNAFIYMYNIIIMVFEDE